jgi:hypothetical protein
LNTVLQRLSEYLPGFASTLNRGHFPAQKILSAQTGWCKRKEKMTNRRQKEKDDVQQIFS